MQPGGESHTGEPPNFAEELVPGHQFGRHRAMNDSANRGSYGRQLALEGEVIFEGVESDEDAIAELVYSLGGPAIEFGASYGRCTVAIARRGIRTTGVEISASLAKLHQRHTESAEVEVELIQGDFLEDFNVREKYRCAVCVGNTLFMVNDQEKQMRFFDRAASLLEPNGYLVVQATRPAFSEIDFGRRDGTDSVGTIDWVSQTAQYVGTMRSGRCLEVSYRWMFPGEIDLMARIAGFQVSARPPQLRSGRSLTTVYQHVAQGRLT